jgi:threonine aldolase
VVFDVNQAGLTGDEFNARTMKSHGVRFSVLGPHTVRAVTHLDIPADGIDQAIAAVRAAIGR